MTSVNELFASSILVALFTIGSMVRLKSPSDNRIDLRLPTPVEGLEMLRRLLAPHMYIWNDVWSVMIENLRQYPSKTGKYHPGSDGHIGLHLGIANWAVT